MTGDIGLRSMPRVALQALEQGIDTPSLYILAGFSDDENEFMLDKYLKEALRELSIILPDKRQAALEVGLAIAEEILTGKRNAFEGVRDIKWKAIDAYPFYEETKHYCYDSINFEKVYGLFDSIDNLRDAGSTQWQSDKTNKELEEELTQSLLTELKVWTEQIKTAANTCLLP